MKGLYVLKSALTYGHFITFMDFKNTEKTWNQWAHASLMVLMNGQQSTNITFLSENTRNSLCVEHKDNSVSLHFHNSAPNYG